MLSEKTSRWLALPLLLLVATATNAVPTMSEYEGHFIVRTSFLNPHLATPSTYGVEINVIGEACNSRLASIAAEFLKPPAASTYPQAPPIHASSLPPIPGTLSMALTGLLCVSLVKDRKVWMAALAAILWAGQAGFGALPQLASHLCSKKQVEQRSAANVTYVCGFGSSARLRSDIEGTQYIGLLHHLAGIPAKAMSLPLPLALVRAQRAFSPQCSRRGNNLCSPCNHRTVAETEDKFRAPQFAIINALSYLTQASNCLARGVEQPICFSPAFIFANLARGPPNPA